MTRRSVGRSGWGPYVALVVLAACGSTSTSKQTGQQEGEGACAGLADGAACGTGLVCASGACVAACAPARLCDTGNPCTLGTSTCASPWSAPGCEHAGQKQDGTTCGDGRVCSGGTCVDDTRTACTGLADGTPCGNSFVCAGGACVAACMPARQCVTGHPCTLGTTTCASPWSAPGCAVAGQRPDGTPCGSGAVCSAGACVAASSIARVWVADAVATVNGTATLVADVTVGSGAPSRDVEWSTDGCDGAWVSPSRGTATTFHAPGWPDKCRVRAVSVADPSKSDFAYVVVKPAWQLVTPLSIPIGSEPYAMIRGHAGLTSEPDLCVASTGAGTLRCLDPRSGALRYTVPVGANPRGDMGIGGMYEIWVALTAENKVARASGSTVQRYDVGSQPHGVAATSYAVWVANLGSSSLTKLDAFSGALLGTFDLRPWGRAPTGIAHDGRSLWVATSDAVLNLSESGVLLRTPIPAADPYGITYDPFNGYVWFANHASNTIVRIQPSTGATATFQVGRSPLGIAPTSAGTVWVANTGDDTVSEVRAIDGTILATLKAGPMPYGVLFDSTWSSLWVTTYGGGVVRRLF